MAGLEDLFARTKVKNPCYKCNRRTEICHAKCPDHAEYIELRKAERLETARLKKERNCADEYAINQAEKSKRIRMNKNRK